MRFIVVGCRYLSLFAFIVWAVCCCNCLKMLLLLYDDVVVFLLPFVVIGCLLYFAVCVVGCLLSVVCGRWCCLFCGCC